MLFNFYEVLINKELINNFITECLVIEHRTLSFWLEGPTSRPSGIKFPTFESYTGTVTK